MRPSSRTLPSESGAPRCGQKSSSAAATPSSARKRTTRLPQIVRPSGPAAISSGVQAAYQALRTYTRNSPRTGACRVLIRRSGPQRAARAGADLLAVLDRLVGRLRHRQVLLQGRQRLCREALEVAVVSRL